MHRWAYKELSLEARKGRIKRWLRLNLNFLRSCLRLLLELDTRPNLLLVLYFPNHIVEEVELLVVEGGVVVR